MIPAGQLALFAMPAAAPPPAAPPKRKKPRKPAPAVPAPDPLLSEADLQALRHELPHLFELPADDCVVPTGIFADSWAPTGDDHDDASALMDRNLALAMQAARRGAPFVDRGEEYDDEDEVDQGDWGDPRHVPTRQLLVELGMLPD